MKCEKCGRYLSRDEEMDVEEDSTPQVCDRCLGVDHYSWKKKEPRGITLTFRDGKS